MEGLYKLEDAFKEIDRKDKGLNKIVFVNCNKQEFDNIEEYVLYGFHAIWNFKIISTEDNKIELLYNDIKIDISLNLIGAY